MFGTSLLETPPSALASRDSSNSPFECFVDNISIGSTPWLNFAQNNVLLCENEHLTDGQHKITINVNATTWGFWFDYIQYTPSPSLSLETAVVVVDDLDPGIILDSNWEATGYGYSMTQVPDSTATFQFTGMCENHL